MNIGNWININKHPDIGLIPSSFWSSICFFWSFWGSFLYLSWSSLNLGWNSVIFAEDFVCWIVSGRSINLIINVNMRISRKYCQLGLEIPIEISILWISIKKLVKGFTNTFKGLSSLFYINNYVLYPMYLINIILLINDYGNINPNIFTN